MTIRMKLLNVSQTDRVIGGSDVYFRALSDLLSAHGHAVENFCASEEDDRLPSHVNFNNPKLKDIINFIYNKRAGQLISHKVDVFSPDIAHLHIYYGQLSSSILPVLKKKCVPIVQTLHEYKLVCPVYTMYRNDSVCFSCSGGAYFNCIKNRCNRGSLARSCLSAAEQVVSKKNGSESFVDRFISVSQYQKNLLVKMGVRENKIDVVHNFVDTKSSVPSEFVGEYFLYFGRVEKVKGLDKLIEAVSLLKGRGINLVVAGSGGYLDEAVEYSQSLGVSAKVKFLGHCSKSRIRKLLKGCVASITPSVWPETFGLTLLESFSEQRTVIASNIGGMSEIIEDGETGYLVCPGDVGSLAERIEYLYDNPQVAEAMGLRAGLVVNSKFSEESHYRKLMKIYEGVL